MIRQCAILFGCLALGELIVFLTDIKLPSSIIGMLLLTLFLKLGWIKLHWVQGMSDFLVANLGFFFIPPGVALMLYFDIIAAEFWPIVTASSSCAKWISRPVALAYSRNHSGFLVAPPHITRRLIWCPASSRVSIIWRVP